MRFCAQLIFHVNKFFNKFYFIKYRISIPNFFSIIFLFDNTWTLRHENNTSNIPFFYFAHRDTNFLIYLQIFFIIRRKLPTTTGFLMKKKNVYHRSHFAVLLRTCRQNDKTWSYLRGGEGGRVLTEAPCCECKRVHSATCSAAVLFTPCMLEWRGVGIYWKALSWATTGGDEW